jgi:alkanesulfonate monooxygenase SsuD/methylene tetrahydromethanopterin reductase-like flavin-dependent oxidoreductase (luciferase family)
VRSSIPIHIPALFENTVALAGEVADGLLGHPVWSLKWIAQEAALLDRTLAAKARKRSDVHVNLWNYAAIANDSKQAIDDMRGTVAFYSSVAQYQKYYAAHGFGAQAIAATEAAGRKDTDAMLKAVPDEMVTTFAIAGTPDDARASSEDVGIRGFDDPFVAAVFRSARSDEHVPERDCRHTLQGLTAFEISARLS